MAEEDRPGAGVPWTQEISPPSLRAEAAFVLRAAFALLLGAGALIALQRGARGTATDATTLGGEFAGGVVAFADLAAGEQRLVRAIQEGVLEAENARSRSGSWPAVETLAAEGVPPFAADPIDRAGYRWTKLQDGLLVNYVGAPSAGGSAGFLVLIQEPMPGYARDPRAPTDEVHHRLADGTLLHVSIWTGAPLGELGAPLGTAPIERGWRRVTFTRSSS